MEQLIALPDGTRISVTATPGGTTLSIMFGWRKTEYGVHMDSFTQVTLTPQSAAALREAMKPVELKLPPQLDTKPADDKKAPDGYDGPAV